MYRLIPLAYACDIYQSGPDGAVIMSAVNGPVGTGFASRYRLQQGYYF